MIDAPRSLLHRPKLWAPVLVVLALAALWWFAWMAPEASKLASVRLQHTNDQLTVASLEGRLAHLRTDKAKEDQAKRLLAEFAEAIPASPDSPALVSQIYRLATSDLVDLESITDNTVDPATGGYSTIPVTLTISGSLPGIRSFVDGLYNLRRLITVQQLSVSGGSPTSGLLGGGSGSYTATITGTAYTTSVAAAPATPGASGTSSG